jgi:hypothetical protein
MDGGRAMSHRQRGKLKFDDSAAVAAIARFDEPLRMALASILWWDNVPHHTAMPKTQAAMCCEVTPRAYPTSWELIAAMVQIGFDQSYAEARIIGDNKTTEQRMRHIRRMRARRARGLR